MPEDAILRAMQEILTLLRTRHVSLPRGELTRRYAIAITEQEKVLAYYKTWIFAAGEGPHVP
jgi:hypothetical protein